MALVKGTNCGLVLAAPGPDPTVNPLVLDGSAWAVKDTAPAGAVKITEIGWWCANNTEEANFEVAIYDHNVGDNNPEAVVGIDQVNAKGTTGGWKRVTGLNIAITPATIYWIALQVDQTATATDGDRAAGVGEKFDLKTAQAALPDPWGASTSTFEQLAGIYAVYETEAVAADDRYGAIRQQSCRGTDVPGIYP